MIYEQCCYVPSLIGSAIAFSSYGMHVYTQEYGITNRTQCAIEDLI